MKWQNILLRYGSLYIRIFWLEFYFKSVKSQHFFRCMTALVWEVYAWNNESIGKLNDCDDVILSSKASKSEKENQN